jgi:predicted DNA-binding transcriptional regulator YafY
MPRGEQLARQWKILQYLSLSRYGKSVQELADHLECRTRTIYRDLNALYDAGFPVYSEKINHKNLWTTDDTSRQPPIPFTLQELMALHFSRGMLKIFKDTIFHDALETLFSKVETTLPPESIKYLNRVEQTLHVGFSSHKPYDRYKDIIAQVNNSAVAKHTLTIHYHTMSTNKDSIRRVDPYLVWFFNGAFYLIGYCHTRHDVRTFAISRIKKIEPSKTVFTVPKDFSLEQYISSCFSLFHGEMQKVKIQFSPQAAGYIQEQIWHKSQQITNQDDGSIIFEAEVAGTSEIKSWIMSWGAQAKVITPKELQQEIVKEARIMAGIPPEH